jgi:hypoxanthine phosphoribosyltransferase
MRSYDYARRSGVRRLSWTDIAALSAGVAEELDAAGVEVVVGIARAGLIPATLVACALRRELYPVRVTRRVDDVVQFPSPVWKVPLAPEVAGRVVAVVDEIADTGETLALVERSAREQGAARVLTATLVRHSWADPPPDICPLVSDELLIFPWDRRVLIGGRWRQHPEIAAALKAQAAQQEHPGSA